MKSIKEMAEEYTCVIENQVTNNASFGAYRSGANYVLEEIEYILEDKELDCEEICDSLFALIEQLRK